MNWKIVGMIAAVVIIVAIAGGVGFKLMQKAEGYKATGDQYIPRVEPRFGCATVNFNFGGKDGKESKEDTTVTAPVSN